MYDILKNNTALCLVGGFGTRVQHILNDIPKPLAEINGHPFLYWQIKHLKAYGIHKIILLTHHRNEQFINFVNNYSSVFGEIKCRCEISPEGTGGSILSALEGNDEISGEFLVVNGDTLVDLDYSKMISALDDTCDVILAGLKVMDASRYGTLEVNQDNFLIDFREKKEGSGLINTGVIAFKKKIFQNINIHKRPFSLERELMPLLLKQEYRVKVKPVAGSFIDIGTEETLNLANGFINNFFDK